VFGLKWLLFTLYVTIFVLKFSFQLLLSLVHSDFRLYFVSVLLNIFSVSLFVSVNEIMSFSVSVSISINEYITETESGQY